MARCSLRRTPARPVPAFGQDGQANPFEAPVTAIILSRPFSYALSLTAIGFLAWIGKLDNLDGFSGLLFLPKQLRRGSISAYPRFRAARGVVKCDFLIIAKT